MFRLKDIVGGRPVGILLHGKSIEELEHGIYDVGKGEFCWMSLNNFMLPEQTILSKIGDALSVVAVFSEQIFKRHKDDIVAFLNRPDNNLLITSQLILGQMEYGDRREFIHAFRSKIYLSEGLPVMWRGKVGRKANSAALLLCELMAADVQNIYVFGMDGIAKSPTYEEEKASYYHEEIMFPHPSRRTSIGLDTLDFNRAFPAVYAYWKQHGYKGEIWNCNPASHITALPLRSLSSALQNVLDKTHKTQHLVQRK